MKSLKEFLAEALSSLDDKLLKKHKVSQDDLEDLAKKCGMTPAGRSHSDAAIDVTVSGVDDKTAEKLAGELKMQELTDKQIKEIRKNLNMRERTWIAKLDDDLAIEFLWLGAKASKPSPKATIRVFSISKFGMADVDFLKFI